MTRLLRMVASCAVSKNPSAIPAGFIAFIFLACSNPYRPIEGWSDKDLEAIGHYYSSIRASNEYLRITKVGGDVKGRFAEQEYAAMRNSAKEAANEARLFLGYPATLDKMHPEMQMRFRDEYLRSLDLTVHGLEYKDESSAHQADKMYNTFVDWFKTHREEIRFPRGA